MKNDGIALGKEDESPAHAVTPVGLPDLFRRRRGGVAIQRMALMVSTGVLLIVWALGIDQHVGTKAVARSSF